MTLLPPSNAQKILTSLQIEQKINRMAYEILEINYQEKEIVILGIEDGGFKLAGLLAMKVQTIQDIQIDLFSIYVNKEDLFSETPFIRNVNNSLQNKHIILVDDVGNSGATLFHALQTIYPLHPLSIHVAVLIDRTHKKFPIKADIIGLDLATTMTNHIHVVFDENGAPEGAYVY